jgi:SLT domain-containing protein
MVDLAIVGSVGVEVLPDVQKFNSRIRAKLLPQADALGRDLGKAMARRVSEQIRDGISDGLSKGELPAATKGRKTGDVYGGAFGKAVQQKIGNALRNLPDAKIGANTSEVDQKLALIKQRMEALRDARIGIDVDDATAVRHISALQADLAVLARQSASPAIRLNAGKAALELAAFKAELDDVDRQNVSADVSVKGAAGAIASMSGLTKAVLALGPALIPIAAAGTVGLLGLTSAAIAAGAGAGGLALVAVPAFKHVTEALQKAKTEGAAALDGLTLSEKNAYAALHRFTGQFQTLTNGLQSAVLPPLMGWVETLGRQLPRLDPVIRSAARGLGDFQFAADAAFRSPSFINFTQMLTRQAGPAVSSFGRLLIGLTQGLGNIALAMEPFASRINRAIAGLGTSFARLTASAGFSNFVAAIARDAPLVGRFFGALGRTLAGLVQALEPLGRATLSGLTAAMQSMAPLLPQLKDLGSALAGAARAMVPLVTAYGQFAVLLASGTIGLLTKLAQLVERNAAAFQLLAGAIIAVKLTSFIRDAALASGGMAILTRAVQGYRGEVALMSTTKLVAGAGATSKAFTGVQRTTGGLKGALAGVVGGLSATSVAFGAVGVLAGAAALGFISASRETQKASAIQNEAYDRVAETINLLRPSANKTALSMEALNKAGAGFLAIQSNLGFAAFNDGKAVAKFTELKQSVKDASGFLGKMGRDFGVSADQAGVLAGQAGYTGEQIADLGAAYREYNQAVKFGKQLNGSSDMAFATEMTARFNAKLKDLYGNVRAAQAAIRGASDPTYALGQAMRDLNSKVPTDRIKAFNDGLTAYGTTVAGVTGSTAAAGDSLAALHGIFNKNVTASQLAGAAQNVLNDNLLRAGPQTRGLASALVGLNGQYLTNLQNTFRAAGGAKNLAEAGAAVTKVSQEQKKALYDNLIQMGFSAKAASQLAEKYGSIPRDLRAQIRLSGHQAANKTVDSLKKKLVTLKPTSLTFKADAGKAQKDIDKLRTLAKDMPKSIRVRLLAEATKAQEALDLAKKKATEFAKNSYAAKLVVNSVDATKKLEEARKHSAAWAKEKYVALLTADAKQLAGKVTEAKKHGGAWAKEKYVALLTADSKEAAAKVEDAKRRVGPGWAKSKYVAKLSADAKEAARKVEEAKKGGNSWAKGKYLGRLTGDAKDAQKKADTAKKAGAAFSKGKYLGLLKGNADDATAKANRAARDALRYSRGLYKGVLTADGTKANRVADDATTRLKRVGESAQTATQRIIEMVNKNYKNIRIEANGFWSVKGAAGGSNRRLARGGLVDGPGTTTSDSIPVNLSRKEYVQPARVVAREGVPAMEALRTGRATIVPRQGFADGGLVGGGVFAPIPTGAQRWLTDNLNKLAKTVAAEIRVQQRKQDAISDATNIAFKAGAGVAQWSSLVLRALAANGQPASLLGITLRRMNQESGGNPRAINNSDINAQRGDPSRGLMQTIMATFRAYHAPGTSNNIYDPFANIMASMRYALARYGSLASAYNRPGGYVHGGRPRAGELAWVGEKGPELVDFHGPATVYTTAQSRRMAPMVGGIRGYATGSGAQDATGETRARLIASGEKLVSIIMQGMNGTKSRASIQAASEKVIATLRGAFTGARESVVVAYAARENRQLQEISKARSRITNQLTAYATQQATGRAQARDFANVSSLTDTRSSNGVVHALTAKLVAITTFSRNLQTLRKRGLSNQTIQQLMDAGPETGGPIAAQLVHGSFKNLVKVNTLQRRITQAAATYGTLTANVNVGGSIAGGFVSGLRTRRAELHLEASLMAEQFARKVRGIFTNKAGGAVATRHDTGGFLPMGYSFNLNQTGRPEPILSPVQEGQLRDVLRLAASRRGADGTGPFDSAVLADQVGQAVARYMTGAALVLDKRSGRVFATIVNDANTRNIRRV